jgi:hypothetical protein
LSRNPDCTPGAESGRLSASRSDGREAIAPVVGRGLRVALISQPAQGLAARGSGMAIFDPDNRVVSATPEAVEWFGEIESVRRLHDPLAGIDVPSEVIVSAQEARARAADPTALARARADDQRDRAAAAPLAVHRAGPPQVGLREGRRLEPWRVADAVHAAAV